MSRSLLPLLATFASLVAQACVSASVSSVQQHLAEMPIPASAFNDSVGVNTHFTYRNTVYDTSFDALSSRLMHSQIKHARDAFCNWGTSSDWCAGVWASRWNTLASAGIAFDVITNPWMGWSAGTTGCHGTCLSGYVAALGLAPGSIDAYEGPNECDDAPRNCLQLGRDTAHETQSVIAAWTPLIWNLRTGRTAIYGPAMAFPRGYSAYSNISAYVSYGAIHNYTKPFMPETNRTCCSLTAWQSGASHLSGAAPLVSTETGFNTDPTFSNGGISQLAQERYIPRMLFTNLANAIKRTYIYELVDYPTDTPGQDFGLLNADCTPKPAWTRLQQLMSYFADNRTSVRRPLHYGILASQAGLHHVLFQRSNGTYLLVLWLGVPVWDPGLHEDVPLQRQQITVTLQKTPVEARMVTFGDHGAIVTRTLTVLDRRVPVEVTSLVSVLSLRF